MSNEFKKEKCIHICINILIVVLETTFFQSYPTTNNLKYVEERAPWFENFTIEFSTSSAKKFSARLLDKRKEKLQCRAISLPSIY